MRRRWDVSVRVASFRCAAIPRKRLRAATAASTPAAGAFDTPQQAADALVDAAEKFDVAALTQILGPDGKDIVFSGEFAQDRKHAADFAAQAREKKSVSVDPKTGVRAFLLVGNEDWPFPVPLVKRGGKWPLTAKPAGRNCCTAASAPMNWMPSRSAMATWKRSTNMRFSSAG